MCAAIADKKMPNGWANVLELGRDAGTLKEIRIAADSGSRLRKNAGMTMRQWLWLPAMFGGQHSEHDAAPMELLRYFCEFN